ncbi:MAG: proteasome assembly chaperone family protein [Euryarchaeota archaeon]|nr:proteasome assembly chaperone family protein [Euryarchaeota archaeon]
MDEVTFKWSSKPELSTPTLVEGLPGVGNVGKLAAEHLIDELKAEKFIDIFSKHFPPQVLIKEDGTIKLVRNEVYFHRSKDAGDLIILTGDYQGHSPEGQYVLSDAVLKELVDYKLKRIYTLGGWSTGRIVDTPRVLGAATSLDMVKALTDSGVTSSSGEPGGGIVGAGGLLIGLGNLMGIEGACLMGETSGYFVDPKSARSVLEALTKILGVTISFAQLEEKAKQIEALTSRIKEMEPEQRGPKDDLGYIG